MVPHQVLAPYLTPQQTTLLRYGGALPPTLQDELCQRLHAELGALQTLLAEPMVQRDSLVDQREGTLLCADLSGFTALTERLATRGRQGVEELSAIINTLFGALLKAVTTYGGVVLTFSGDALTVFFDSAQLGAQHSALACTAAFAMQQRMDGFAAIPTSCGVWTLRLRVGVHSGQVFVARLGNETRRELLVAGGDVNRATLVEERALPGEVLLSPEAFKGLGHHPHYVREDGLIRLIESPEAHPVRARTKDIERGDNSLATAVDLASRIARLRLYLPDSLPQRFISHFDGEATGEFRPVTTVFVNFFSFADMLACCAGQEQLALQAANAYYTRTQEVIHAYGGTINKLDVASFGERMLALFGAPLAQEDDPRQAVLAAMELRGALREANQEITRLLGADFAERRNVGTVRDLECQPEFQQRIGIATGTVFAGLVGGSQRREYTVIGQTVNLAARLMAAGAPGDIMLAPSTWSVVAPHIALKQTAPLTLKGIPAPVSAALALRPLDQAAAPTSTQQSPLVGRETEIDTLRALVAQTRDGIGGVVALSGEAGLGKSRLLQEVQQDAAERSLHTVAVACRSYTATSPYSLIRDLLVQAFELPTNNAPQEMRTALQRIVATYAPDLQSLTPLLYSIVGIGRTTDRIDQRAVRRSGDERSFAAETMVDERRAEDGIWSLPPAERRERLHDLLDALIDGFAAQQTLVLVLDDVHWADASSLEVIQRFIKLTVDAHLLVVLAYRPDPDIAEPWSSLPQTTQLQLQPLERTSSEALLATLLDGIVPVELLALLDRAQGSPFFLESLVHHLIDTNELQRNEANRWKLRRPLDSIALPIDIERLLIARLDRLEEPTRALVQVAAVIGSRITYPVLAGLYAQSQQLAQRLTHLVHIGILRIDELDEEEPFRFQHTLLREVAYNSILYTKRRELHRRVARRMESLPAGQNATALAELAHHFLLAEEWQQACAYSLQMGSHAQARYATTEALASYRQAYQLVRQHPDAIAAADRYAALEGLADVDVLAGWYDEAHGHYRTLLALNQEAEAAPELQATLLRKIGMVYEHQGQFDDALEWMQRARTALDATGERAKLERARVCNDIGWVFFRRGDLEQTQHWLEQALRLLGDDSDHAVAEIASEKARIQNRLGGVAWSRGDLVAAQQYVEKALAIWTKTGDLLGQADAQNNLGVLADQCGEWDTAIERYEEARAVDLKIGRRREAALSLLNLGIAHFHRGDLHDALSLLEQASTQTALVDDTLHQAMALRWQGRALSEKGRWREAQSALNQALGLSEQHGWQLESLDAHAALGMLALAKHNVVAVEEALAAGHVLLPQVDHQSPETAYFLRFAAQVARQRGDHQQAQTLFEECRAIFTELDMRAEVALTEAQAELPLAHAAAS